MFGNLSAFVDGNMFLGLFGKDLFVRLSDEHRQVLLLKEGASVLEPMKGKPMKDYVILLRAWRDRPESARQWVFRSLDWASKLPPKKTKK